MKFVKNEKKGTCSICLADETTHAILLKDDPNVGHKIVCHVCFLRFKKKGTFSLT